MLTLLKNLVGRQGKKSTSIRRLQKRLRLEPTVELLHTRTLPSATPVALNPMGQLLIQGTPADDTVHISINASQQVEVDYNGALSQFDPAQVKVIVFNGGGGNDLCDNGTGIRSIMRGGAGDDTLEGGSSKDVILGQAGNDSLLGGQGNDSELGGSGDDDLLGDDGDDTLQGGQGNDSEDGGTGDDSVLGGQGADDLTGDQGDDTLVGGMGSDTAAGGSDDDSVLGGQGNDDLAGDDGNDTLQGGQGSDTEDGGTGDDSVEGGQGDDDLQGGIGNDNVKGAAGSDLVHGGLGDDTCNGGSGSDVVNGDQGIDDNSSGEQADNSTQLVASLTSDTGASGVAAFQSEQEDNGTQVEFELEIHGADPKTTYDVVVAGQTVGQVTTDQNGEGKFELHNPANFPAVQNNSTIAVGDVLTGTFGTFSGDDESSGSVTNLRASLTAATNATGIAVFQSKPEDGGTEVEFEVEIHNAAVNTTYDVVVGGQTVGQIKTNDEGEGELHLTNPQNFPAVQDGTTIAVGDVLSGTFSATQAHD